MLAMNCEIDMLNSSILHAKYTQIKLENIEKITDDDGLIYLFFYVSFILALDSLDIFRMKLHNGIVQVEPLKVGNASSLLTG